MTRNLTGASRPVAPPGWFDARWHRRQITIGNAVEHDGAEAYGPPPRDGYPTARTTDRRGIVTSPYAPHHQIDVTDIPHGALVRDPSCDRLFVNP